MLEDTVVYVWVEFLFATSCVRWPFSQLSRAYHSKTSCYLKMSWDATDSTPRPELTLIYGMVSISLIDVQPVPVATCYKAWVCGRSIAGIVVSNPTEGMDVCCECPCCQVKFLWWADHSFRGDLPTVVHRCVWSRNLKNEEAMARVCAQRHRKTQQVEHEKCIVSGGVVSYRLGRYGSRLASWTRIPLF
jgi:hypothetical protein